MSPSALSLIVPCTSNIIIIGLHLNCFHCLLHLNCWVGWRKLPAVNISKTIGYSPINFLQLDRMLNPNICYTFVVMATNSDVSCKNAFFRIISGCSVNTKNLSKLVSHYRDVFTGRVYVLCRKFSISRCSSTLCNFFLLKSF